MTGVTPLEVCKNSLEPLKERIIKLNDQTGKSESRLTDKERRLRKEDLEKLNNKYRGLAMSFLKAILTDVKEEFTKLMSSIKKSHFKELIYRMLDLHLAREIEHYGPFIEKYIGFVTNDDKKFPIEFTDGIIELCTRTHANLMAILTAWKYRARTKPVPPFVADVKLTPRQNMEAFNEAVLAHYYYYELAVRIKYDLTGIFDRIKEDIEKVDEIKNKLGEASVTIRVQDIADLGDIWPVSRSRYPK